MLSVGTDYIRRNIRIAHNSNTGNENTSIKSHNYSSPYHSSQSILADYKKGIITFKGTRLDRNKVESLGIPNLQFIDNDCLRGSSLSSRANRKYLIPIKNAGIENIIDLRDAYSSEHYSEMCENAGLNYFHIPVDSSSVETRKIIDNFPVLFNVLNKGKTYIACAQGLHRTDIAIALNYIFNEKSQKNPPVMYGHFRDYGFKFDDIARRVYSIKKELTPSDLKNLGWDEEKFESEYIKRKNAIVDYNTLIAKR